MFQLKDELTILNSKVQDLMWKFEEKTGATLGAVNINRTKEGIPEPFFVAILFNDDKDKDITEH
jgi:hypothetical protein